MLSQDTQDTIITCEMDTDETSMYNELLNELELREISILRRMANNKVDPIYLREKVRNLGRAPEVEGDDRGDGRARHRQSQLKLVRHILKKSDERDTNVGGGRLWVDVDEAGCPTGQHRFDWLRRLQGYSHDLDWSVDNFKAHPRPLLMAIKEKMAAQFEYRGGLNDVPEEIFFQILRQQMRTRRSNMKKLIKSGRPLPLYIKKQHVDNFKKLIARTEKIAEATQMKVVRQTDQNLSYSGRSKGEVRSRFVSNILFSCILVNDYVTSYNHIF